MNLKRAANLCLKMQATPILSLSCSSQTGFPVLNPILSTNTNEHSCLKRVNDNSKCDSSQATESQIIPGFREMRLPESLKAGLRAFTTSRYTPPKEVIKNIFSFPNLAQQLPTSVHDTPAGSYPSEGPQPSKWPVGSHKFKNPDFLLQGAFLLPLRHPLHHRGHLAGQVCLDTGDWQLIISQEQLGRSIGFDGSPKFSFQDSKKENFC